MTNIFFAVFLAFFYSIVYTVAGPMIAAQDIKFDQSQLLSFAVCFILSSAVNFFIFSVQNKNLADSYKTFVFFFLLYKHAFTHQKCG